MARIDSILSLDKRDIESLWLAMYGYLNAPRHARSHAHTYLGLLDGATAGEYLAIQEGIAACDGELVIPPSHLRAGLLEAAEIGSIGGLIVADPSVAPPAAERSLCLSTREGKPLDVVAHLYQNFVKHGTVDGVRVSCDDSTAATWFAATGELPIVVIHSGTAEIDPAFREALEAEGQAGRYRRVLRTDMRCDIDARKPPAHAHLGAAIAAALEYIAA